MADKSNHITYFKVENFKRFSSFEMSDIKQFNLIVGDNNVGKTSILEALLTDEDIWTMKNNLTEALLFRGLKNKYSYGDLELYLNREISINKKDPAIIFYWKTNSKNGCTRRVLFNRNTQQVRFDNGLNPIVNEDFFFNRTIQLNLNITIPYTPFYKGHDDDLANFYSKLQGDREVKASFIEALKVIIPEIDNIELSSPYHDQSPHLIVFQKHLRTSIPLALFGDGALKLFRLLAEIVINRGKRLMIDEIDTGVHYSRMKDFWGVIIKTARDNDVQLFMTTHSKECIGYFVEVLEESFEIIQDEVRCFTLEELPDKTVKSYAYTYPQLEANIRLHNEVRGGNR